METLQIAQVIVIHIMAVMSTLFVVLYARSPWRDTAGGRALMVSELGFAVYLDYVVVMYWTHIITDDSLAGHLIGLGIVLLISAGRIYLLRVLSMIQREQPQLMRWGWRRKKRSRDDSR